MAGLYEAPSMMTLKVGLFKGADFSVPEDQMKPYRAAKSENMMPDANGEVRKRPGVQFEKTIDKNLFGKSDDIVTKNIIEIVPGVCFVTHLYFNTPYYTLYAGEPYTGKYFSIVNVDQKPTIVKCGRKTIAFLICDNDMGDMAGEIGGHKFNAAVVEFGERTVMYTDDGYKHYCGAYGVESSLISSDDLTTPVIVHGGNPDGAGNPYQNVNLLNPWVTESFCCTKDANGIFYLHNQVHETDSYETKWWGNSNDFKNNFKVQILISVLSEEDKNVDENGVGLERLVWVDRKFGAKDAYRPMVNRFYLDSSHNKKGGSYTDANGKVVTDVNVGGGTNGFIAQSPVKGEDNVRITHWRADFQRSFIDLCRCACSTFYGVGGYKDRLFVGKGNRVYYSEMDDFLYIGDLNYIETEKGTEIMALSGVGDSLAIMTDQGICFAQGTAQNNAEDVVTISDAVFTVSSQIPAPAPLHYGNTAVLGGEIVYLSAEGVIAVAYEKIYAERFAEHRSALIDREMMKDHPQELISLGRFLMVRCKNGVWWLLDENQPNKEGDQPFSNHQYEGFRLTGMPADVAWAEGETIKLISDNTQCKWMDGSSADHYRDQYGEDVSTEKAISAWWETPWLYGNTFYRKKIFMKLGVLLGEFFGADTSVKVEGRKNEEDWKLLWDYDGTLCTFNYGNIDYRLFTYALTVGCPDIARKIKIKKAMRFKLRFTNDFINQSFILREFGLDYVQED